MSRFFSDSDQPVESGARPQSPPGLLVPDLTPAEAEAWDALLLARRWSRAGPMVLASAKLIPDEVAAPLVASATPLPLASAKLGPDPLTATGGLIAWSEATGWAVTPTAQGEARALLELYLPLLPAHPMATLTLGHLGQSLDGYIATARGESRYVTGPANIRHLHCLRALVDAVLVGAETVAADDPRLTTRLVPGDNPARVILDPRRRLPEARQVFQDGAAPSLLVCAAAEGLPHHWGQAEVLAVPMAADGRLRLEALVAELHRRGLRHLFVEGGGLTVSRFLAAGLLDRLHLAVAPLVIGEGRRGLSLPASPALGDCLRPSCRVFRLGADLLFDCETRPGPGGAGARAVMEPRGDNLGGAPVLSRVY